MSSLRSQIIGPAVFSFTYVKTVSTYPKAIFFVSTAAVTLSFIFLLFVRLPDSENHAYTTIPREDDDNNDEAAQSAV